MPLARIQYPSPGFSQHWKEPAGKNMLKRVSSLPTVEEIQQFNSLYLKCDTLADKVVVDLFEGLGHKQGHALLNTLLEKGLEAVPEIPDSLRNVYTQSYNLPSWLDDDLMQTGAEFCQRAGLFSLVTLRNYSLMGGYESAAINKPLIFTGALKAGPAKRLSDTLAFWVDATGTGAMKPGAVGFNATIKIRIVHALARYYTRKSPEWSDDQWGIPVNEGDMIATYLGFSLVFLEGLYMQGFQPSEEEVKGIFHLWKYIGYMLGIHADLLPENKEQAIQTLYKWTMTQPPADGDTLALAHALMTAPLTVTFPEKNWQKKLLVKIYLGFNYFYLGKHACKRMKLPFTVFVCVPYISACINSINEYKIKLFPKLRQRAVQKGREAQVKITDAFLLSTGYGK
ncbi:oxygenase MpaB family protein [Cytophaga aurantiaca]|uniref:oxygenase MpaB family protein n=1 Tax=Cytophaga aurantiaca TaxID=29530 RepID=UPI000381BE57|nr:oxygenase MpaB family protein [Cytophaga aurantiaca]